MKLSYTDLLQAALRQSGNISVTGTALSDFTTDFGINLSQRYQMVMAKLEDYMTQVPKTAATVASQQYYHYPVGMVNVESVVITIGSVNYPLEIINSQRAWDLINAMTLQPSAIPQFFFPRRDDFGIWPIPQDAYTITFGGHQRDRNLSIVDYNTGTVALANASTTVTGTGTTFASYMKGMWLQVTDTTQAGWGYWYRIASYSSATSLTLENYWQDTTITGAAYRIGQVPDIPDEGHIILVDGVLADYYGGMRNDIESATWFNNRFWTGDGNNNDREEGDERIKGGLIGLMNFYKDRNKSVLIRRGAGVNNLSNTKAWATTLS